MLQAPDRRSVLLGVVVAAGAVTSCSAGKSAAPTSRSSSGSASVPHSSAAPTTTAAELADQRLRARAVSTERRLLAAAAAPRGVEPFASIQAVHSAHLRRLTGSRPAAPQAVKAAPDVAALAAAERSAALTRRADCLAASPELAPLLASIAASSDIAALLLVPSAGG